jgi:hypothetical protein
MRLPERLAFCTRKDEKPSRQHRRFERGTQHHGAGNQQSGEIAGSCDGRRGIMNRFIDRDGASILRIGCKL